MPLYEYQCDACSQRFERIQKFSDPLVEECPSCGGKVRKLLSSPAIQFKGSGWYITDYAKKGSAQGSSGEKSSSDGGDTTDKSKSDSGASTEKSDKPTEKPSTPPAPAKSD
jgi:putative FmdB family regulatory protein